MKKVAVLGSGVMGSAIAAHLANAGIDSLLLDIVPPDDPQNRNKFAARALNEILPNLKPSPIFAKPLLKKITPGNFDDHMPLLKDCDWIVEAVVERFEIKQKVFAEVDKHRKKGSVISSNTSGIPLTSLIEGRSTDFQKNFLITHFFNPVRYMKLVEIVTGTQTSPAVARDMVAFLENTLGKGVVTCKDTPSFIANRVGIYGLMNVIHRAIQQGFSVEAVDKITGPALGRPKSATFRTVDVVGLDTALHVVRFNHEKLLVDECRETLTVPPLLETMLKKNQLGQKAGSGFYKMAKAADGSKNILSLDLKTGEYKEQEKVRFDSLGALKDIEEVREKIKTLVNAKDKAGEFAWETVRDVILYAANRIPEIADDVVGIDNAMKWGFNWDLGPFEILDALGVADFKKRITKENHKIPPVIAAVLKEGDGVFYKTTKGSVSYFDVKSNSYQPVPQNKTHLVLKTLHEQNKVIKSNSGASLVDLGDGVINVEFHTKMNAIDADVGAMMNEAIDFVESDSAYQGVVISNDGPNFSVGANLMLLFMEAQQKNWDAIEKLVKGFQNVCLRLKLSKKPVVVATHGMVLGGGCEITLGADFVRAFGETYIGLVEVGAGLIPGGGGNKNLLLNVEAMLKEKGHSLCSLPKDGGPSPRRSGYGHAGGPFPKVQQCFETIGFAKVATSALEGVSYGYIPKHRFGLTLLRDRLLFDAKQDVLRLAKDYEPPKMRTDILVPGQGGTMALYAGIHNFRLQGLISEHDELIAKKLAFVLTGGHLPNQGFVSESELLDVEREQFLSLCGEEKSQARMQSLLLTGKPLRN